MAPRVDSLQPDRGQQFAPGFSFGDESLSSEKTGLRSERSKVVSHRARRPIRVAAPEKEKLEKISDVFSNDCYQFKGKPGDLIEISRGPYQHWAVYIGGDEVVHFGGVQSSSSFKSQSSSTGNGFHQSLINEIGQKWVNKLLDCMNQTLECNIIGMDGYAMTRGEDLNYDGARSHSFLEVLISKTGKVKREKLSDVVKDDYFQVNNLLDEKYKARDPSIIVKEACKMVGRELQYHVATSNCEHFATKMRYGKAESRQVKEAVISGVAGVASSVYAWNLKASVLAAGGTGLVVAVVVLGAFALYRHLCCKEEEEDNKKIKITNPIHWQKWISAFI